MVEDTIIGSVRRYLDSLAAVGIHASRGVLFGSFAQGRATKDSDIDLIVIASEFDGPRTISMVEALWGATACDSRIEPIPCGEKEWETNQKRPILEIARQEGVVISVN